MSTSALTMIPTPLVLVGPGGDFTRRLNVKGTALQRASGPLQPGGPDADSEGNGAPGHHAARNPAAPHLATAAGTTPRPADAFDTATPATAPTYGPDGQVRQPARVSVLAAAAAWLEMQSLTISDLADDHEHHRRDLLTGLLTEPRFAKPAPRVTVTRLAARMAHAVLPIPFSQSPSPASSPKVIPNEPHPQTAEDPQPHPRNAAHPRLFADDAGAGGRAGRLQGHRLRARGGAHQKRRAQAAGQQSTLFRSVA